VREQSGRGGDPRPLKRQDIVPLAADLDAQVFDLPADDVGSGMEPRAEAGYHETQEQISRQ
jgi:hypothetical protein